MAYAISCQVPLPYRISRTIPGMQTFGDRVRARRKELDLTQAQLAKRTKGAVSQTTVANIEGGRNESSRHIVALAQALNCDAYWLRTGQEMSPNLRPLSNLQDEEAVLDPYVYVTRVEGMIISAGSGQTVFEHEEIDDSHAFRRSWIEKKGLRAERCRILEARGHSMSPFICDGDAVLVNLDDTRIKSGEVYAIQVSDEARIKRIVQRADGSIEIRSDNPSPEFPVEVYGPDTYERIYIIGRVVWRGG